MKVCFLSSMHPALDKRVFEKEALTLAGAGHEVVHICPGKPGVSEERGVKIVQYQPPNGIRSRIAQLPRLYKFARAENADVYHCNEIDSWFVGLFAARGSKVCIFDVHEHYPSAFSEIRFPGLPGFLRPVVASFIRLLYHILSPWTNHFILAKSSLLDDFKSVEHKVIVIRNFSRMPVSMNEKKFQLNREHFDIVHIGAIGRARGWPQMLDALALIGDGRVRLKVVGAFNDNSAPEFWSKAKQLGILDRVKVLDWMRFPEAFRILQSSGVGLIAFQPGIQNHTYASPHKFFDYMAAGLPIVAPEFAEEISWIMRKYEVGLMVDPSDPEEISNAIMQIYASPEMAEKYGRNGIKAVSSQFNWEQESIRLVELYKSL